MSTFSQTMVHYAIVCFNIQTVTLTLSVKLDLDDLDDVIAIERSILLYSWCYKLRGLSTMDVAWSTTEWWLP